MSSGYFEAKECTVEELFKGQRSDDPQYDMPDFQRGYAWDAATKKKEVQILYDDLIQAHRADVEMYFLSSITCFLEDEDSTEPTSEDRREKVIDGQQRLITLTLLMIALEPKVHKAMKTRLLSCIYSANPSKVTRLNLRNAGDREALEAVREEDAKPAPQSNVTKAYHLFCKLVSGMSADDADAFASFVLEKVVLIKNTCLDMRYACQIFEVLNDRGKSLTAYDLIKARFYLEIDHQQAQPKDKREEERSQITENLEDIERQVGQALSNGRKLSSHMRDLTWMLLQTKYPPKKTSDNDGERAEIKHYIEAPEIYQKYKEIPMPNTPGKKKSLEFVKQLCSKEFSQRFIALTQGGFHNNAHLSLLQGGIQFTARLEYLHDEAASLRVFRPLLYVLLEQLQNKAINLEQYETTVRDIFILDRRITLLGKRHVTYAEDLAKIAYQTKREVTRQLQKMCNEEDKTLRADDFKAALEAKPRWSGKDAKLLLFDLCKLSGEERSFVSIQRGQSGDLSIEHILPKGSSKIGTKYGYKATDEEQQNFAAALGNLTLLETKDNSKAGDKPFAEKLKLYEEDDIYKAALAPIFSSITEAAEDNKGKVLWSVKAIKKRTGILIDDYTNLLKFSWEK